MSDLVVDRGTSAAPVLSLVEESQPAGPPAAAADGRQAAAELLRNLQTSGRGLSVREAAHRQLIYGPNSLTRSGGRRWPREILEQFTQPLALLLGVAAVLAWAGGTPALSVAVVAVIVLNAAFAFVQEMQAERAVEALAAVLPAGAHVLRDGKPSEIPASELVPGDVLLIAEGDRVSADGKIIDGSVLLDMSALTGESLPARRAAGADDGSGPLLEATDLVFTGTSVTGGLATVVVTRTGMHTELGRIAVLSQLGTPEQSPLERQVRRATWVIAAVAVGVGALFLPAGLAAGLGWSAAISFSIGLIVANVPEGLLPTITLALAVGVRDLARRGAVVKRLSSVETLGSVTVICTDKTGTLTENRMRVTSMWLGGSKLDAAQAGSSPQAILLASTAAACTTAQPPTDAQPSGSGDPTELALLRLADDLGLAVDPADRASERVALFPFDTQLLRMSSVDRAGAIVAVNVKGAPESVLPLCRQIAGNDGRTSSLGPMARSLLQTTLDNYAASGLRVLAVARRELRQDEKASQDRAVAEADLTLLGLVAMVDPPRAGVATAVTQAHEAGIRVNVITGDYGPTAAEIARQVGIGGTGTQIVTGKKLDALTDAELDVLLAGGDELVFARTSPEGKLRICEGLRDSGEVVAMTGDGVNDAPALRHADIGVAMGRSGTDVAREAATMVLTDDNFATIVVAIEAGRRVFDNVRKFVLYIFAHAVPEVVPFLVFALSGGSIPLPLTVLQILAIDLGTETLPALALGREPAEPGLMQRPPRPRGAGVIDKGLLVRAWLLMGSLSAVLVMTAFLATLWRAGWRLGDPTGTGTPLHYAYLQATTITFVGIVACQIGTAFAARTDRASLFTIGIWSNPLLLWGIAFELVFTVLVVYVPPIQDIFGTAALSGSQLALVAPFPFLVWGADEAVRWLRRRSGTSPSSGERSMSMAANVSLQS